MHCLDMMKLFLTKGNFDDWSNIEWRKRKLQKSVINAKKSHQVVDFHKLAGKKLHRVSSRLNQIGLLKKSMQIDSGEIPDLFIWLLT